MLLPTCLIHSMRMGLVFACGVLCCVLEYVPAWHGQGMGTSAWLGLLCVPEQAPCMLTPFPSRFPMHLPHSMHYPFSLHVIHTPITLIQTTPQPFSQAHFLVDGERTSGSLFDFGL